MERSGGPRRGTCAAPPVMRNPPTPAKNCQPFEILSATPSIHNSARDVGGLRLAG